MSAPPRRPPRLRPGDLVAIVNPSLALPGANAEARLAPTRGRLEAAGLRVQVMPHVGARWSPPAEPGEPTPPTLAGSDEQRAADLNQALRDPSIRLILAAHGGGGAARLVRAGLVDWSALVADPKLLCGFSDFAHIALAAHAYTGLVTVDGPAALQWAAAADEPMLAQARAVLMEPAAAGPLAAAAEWYASQMPPRTPGMPPLRPRPGGWRWLRPGRARGRLVAGMAEMLLTLAELGQAPSLAGAIWVLDPYRNAAPALAETLGHLRARGALDGLAGLVVARPWPGAAEAAELDRVILAATADLTPAPPVLADADVGHTWPRWALPNGVPASLESQTDHFSIDGPAVA